MAQSQPQKPLEVLAAVHRLDPGKLPAYLLEAAILSKEKNLAGAAAVLEQGIKANPKAVNLYVDRSGLADSQKQFEVGESFLLQAIAQDPKNTSLYNHLVRHYTAAGQPDKAEATLRQIVGLEPDREKPVMLLARFLVSQGRRPEAEKTLQDFIMAHPDNYAARFGLAEFYLALRRQGHASQVLEAIVKLDPDGPKGAQAKNGLARIQASLGHRGRAGRRRRRGVAGPCPADDGRGGPVRRTAHEPPRPRPAGRADRGAPRLCQGGAQDHAGAGDPVDRVCRRAAQAPRRWTSRWPAGAARLATSRPRRSSACSVARNSPPQQRRG